jgi:hypothetical protein
MAIEKIHLDTGKDDWLTPLGILDAARAVLGGIDLDPASDAHANARVRARRFYSREEDGLRRPWFGRVWMNHPFSRSGNKLWPQKLVSEYEAGRVTAACMISFAATAENWFAPLMAFLQCYLQPRLAYCQRDGSPVKGATKGSVVTYLGADLQAFHHHFCGLGRVMVPAEGAGPSELDSSFPPLYAPPDGSSGELRDAELPAFLR